MNSMGEWILLDIKPGSVLLYYAIKRVGRELRKGKCMLESEVSDNLELLAHSYSNCTNPSHLLLEIKTYKEKGNRNVIALITLCCLTREKTTFLSLWGSTICLYPNTINEVHLLFRR